MKPDVWRESMSVRIRLEEGTEVRPRRAREAFWRCEQTWESVTRDMVVGGVEVLRMRCAVSEEP